MDKEILKKLSAEKTNLQNLLKFVNNLNKYQKDPINHLDKIKQEVNKIEQTLNQSNLDASVKERVKELVQPIKDKIVGWEGDAKKSFGWNLEQELNKEGFELRGHYPLLKVSFYTLEVNLENFQVKLWYGPQQEKLGTCKLVPSDIVKKLKTIHDRITKRDFNDNEFLSKLYESYKISLYRKNKKIGEPIPISDILFEYAFLMQNKKFRTDPVKTNYKEYGRIFLSYDLYRLKARKFENKELNLITATRAYTQRKSDFLWIPYNEKGEGSYISHLKFKEVKL